MGNTTYKIGEIVALKADTSRKGPIIEILPQVQSQNRYKVFHSLDDIGEYLEDQIMFPINKVDREEMGLKPEEFLVRLNALRLSYPQIDSIYALHAARINFISFQFKPLLRFLRSDQPRLLIADDVGVGKTIEAGLILRELQSRQELKNILILCPKALVKKWQVEMRRFDEEFRPLTAEILRYCLKETYLDNGSWPSQYSRSIVNLELMRREEYLVGTEGRKPHHGLLTLNPPPQFDLLIVDEAHHLRNPDRNTHQLASFLCGISDKVIFLTATPMQMGSKNLFTLLNLLRPDQFIDEKLFEEMIAPNKYLNQAIRHVRTKKPDGLWQSAAHDELDKAVNTQWGRSSLIHDPRFSEWLTQIDAIRTDDERIKFMRDMEDIHTLAHTMNRTRRRDIGAFTIRVPFTISVPFTEEHQRLYDAIISFRKEVLKLSHDPNIIKLIIDTLERQAASCLPGLLPMLEIFIKNGKFTSVTDVSDSDDETKIPNFIIEKARELKIIASSIQGDDPKLENFLNIVSETVNSKGPGKILVFSFFLHTLSYLEKNLINKGYRVAVVNGHVDDEMREDLRDRFRLNRESPDAIDILLSSEVGCEGLDYEFCSRLVNYDIPWNPMRIEQRIGRIDRYGQKAEKVQIYNFITPGTIEERIFFRCFDRLNIFKDTVGDMEDVLGDLTESLTQATLDINLTPEQAEEKAMQLADNAIRLIEEQRRLEKESTELLGLDSAFQEEIENIQKEGRFVTPEEVQQIIDLYLKAKCQNAVIMSDSDQNKQVKLRANKEDRGKLLEDLRKLKRQDRQISEFAHWLEGNDPFLTMTFDQEIAQEHRKIPFITPIHPLTKMAISYWNGFKEPLFTRLEVKDNETKPGSYVFAYYLWETVSLSPGIRLISLVYDLNEGGIENSLSERLSKVLKEAQFIERPVSLSKDLLKQTLQNLEEFIHEKRFKEVENLIEINNQLAKRQLASLNMYYQRRVARVSEEIKSATNERIRRMKESEHDRIHREWENKQQKIEERKSADIISQRVAYGIIEVK